MPNWCSNRVEVYGDEKEIKAWKKVVASKKSVFDFNKIMPMPEELEDTKSPVDVPNPELIEKYGYDNWYDWKIHNWGCKWNINPNDIVVIDDGDEIVYEFSTAWCPPEGIYKEIRSKVPGLSISWFYDEPGMQFAGYL